MRSGSQATRGVADMVLMDDSCAVLAPAVSEGQRILNGMQAILKLFLTRISTVGLVIVSSLVVGEFPLELRQGSLVTLFSVGIPTILLAIWARPGSTPPGDLNSPAAPFHCAASAHHERVWPHPLRCCLRSVAGRLSSRRSDDADSVSRVLWPLPGDLRGATHLLVGDRKCAFWRLATNVVGHEHDGCFCRHPHSATLASALCLATIRMERMCRAGDRSRRLVVGAAGDVEIPSRSFATPSRRRLVPSPEVIRSGRISVVTKQSRTFLDP